MLESVRGAKGAYQLRRPPAEIRLSEIIRLIDGPISRRLLMRIKSEA
jgi:DNA-binding IscR family transcriptional regulator